MEIGMLIVMRECEDWFTRRVDGPVRKLALGGLVIALLGVAPAGASAASTFNLDCSQDTPGIGSPEAPLNSLFAANDVVLGPGDRLLIKRGTRCEGELAPRAEGSAEAPAVIGAYGFGTEPEIVGIGRRAVLIKDASHLVVEDLDVSNPGDAEPLGQGTSIRNGVEVVAATRTVVGVTVRRLTIHDVAGNLTKSEAGSAGIQASATGSPPIRFDRLLIEDNRITDVSRSGISISGTTDPTRPAATDSWPNASTGVVVRGNRVDEVAGDGIVPRGTDGAIVEGNVVSRGNLAGRPLTDPLGPLCNAGIWTFRSNNTVIQKNEVYSMEQNGCDGTGFDLDYRQDGTIIQQNYSHDNAGGFVLLCSDDADRSGDVRFNLSVNDATTINHGPCGIEQGIVGNLDGIRFFNNTVVAPAPSTSIQLGVVDRMFAAGDFEFRNNLIYATTLQPRPMACGEHCSHNLFFNLPASGRSAVTVNPRLVDASRTGNGRLAVGRSFRLAVKSPLRGAGIRLADSGELDYFRSWFDLGKRPAIGFDQGPAIEPKPPDRTVACSKARNSQRQIVRRLGTARRSLKRLRLKAAGSARILRAAGTVRRLVRQKKQRSRAVRINCRGVGL